MDREKKKETHYYERRGQTKLTTKQRKMNTNEN